MPSTNSLYNKTFFRKINLPFLTFPHKNKFAQLCEECGFDYVPRICENLNIQIDGNSLNLKNFHGQNSKRIFLLGIKM
jgi:hypothetical protein